ncbi:MAG: phosphotransferase family protein [Gammaproteobacteria bacterium]|nr:phosphotransferase family protein [Gammaproteobacteria bacterium]MBQ0840223.1 phosphotransferase family protein [Gammaproteobacteria bacterium]
MAADSAQQTLIDDIVARLELALKRRYGEAASVENVAIATLGASNRTLLFDLVEPGSRRRLVLRQETLKSAVSPFISPHDQFEILKVVYGHGVLVPEPIFELEPQDDLDVGYVMACVEGETLPKTLLKAPEFAVARKRFAAQTGEIFAKLHAIDPGEVAFLEKVVDSIDPLAAQISRYDAYGEYHPGLDVGIRWLENNRPKAKPRVFVHGDYRNGNVILSPDGIEAVLDWECAHIGSAMEDFGWVCLRAWRFGNIDQPVGGFGPRDEFYQAYTSNGGQAIDEEEIRWWEIFGSLRWAVLNMMQADGHISGVRRALPFACCGRNTSMIEYDMLMTIEGHFS